MSWPTRPQQRYYHEKILSKRELRSDGDLLDSIIVQNTFVNRELSLRPTYHHYISKTGHERRDQTHPRFPTLFPIIHPLMKRSARYGCPNGSVKVNDIGTSNPLGMFNLNVVTKKPTPAEEFGRPCTRSRDAQPEVSKWGRCQPWRSPKRPPSLKIPA